MDGTLLRTDSLLESVLALLRQNPLVLLGMLSALSRGRAQFKSWVADRIVPDASLLPLNRPLVDWLTEERAGGREMILVTAADSRVARAVAGCTGLFSEVLASDGTTNLKSGVKAGALSSRFGRGGFDYAGNSSADLPVWREARRAVVVGGPALQRKAGKVTTVDRVFAARGSRFASVLYALRIHQWIKNLLVFLPLVAAHRYFDGDAIWQASVAFLAFGFTASAVYVMNDLADLDSDRRHPGKRERPFASGALPLSWGLAMAPVSLAMAAVFALAFLPSLFAWVLTGYLLITSAYSLSLKRIPIVDVMTLAGLYTTRVLAGAAAVTIMPSFWLLALSMFVFLSLALVKRYTELKSLLAHGELTAAGRGWHVDDLPLLPAIGVSSGVAGVVVLALYVDSTAARQLYVLPEALWFICPLLLYWICRLWFKAHRGEVHEDPVVYALSDRVSLLVGLLILGVAALAAGGVTF